MEEISVCIITWNGANYIARQLNSILNQSLLPNEIVLIDDFSDDDTFEISQSVLANYSGDLIILKNEHRSGVNYTISKAFKYATRDIIVLSDQDDFWYPNRLATIKEYFDFHNADIVRINADIEQDSELTNITLTGVRPFSNSLISNAFQNKFIGCQMAIKKKFISKAMPIPIDNDNYYDFYIGMLALIIGKVGNIKKPLGVYCRHSNTVTSLNKRRFFLFIIVTRLKLFQYLILKIVKILTLRVLMKE